MASTLKINNIEPASGTGITLNPTTTVINGTTLTVNATTTTLPTGKKLVGTDAQSIVAPDMVGGSVHPPWMTLCCSTSKTSSSNSTPVPTPHQFLHTPVPHSLQFHFHS